MIEHDKL